MLEKFKKMVENIIIKNVLENPDYLKKISDKWKNNEEFFKGIMEKVEEKFKLNDFSVAEKIKTKLTIYSYMGEELKNNKNFILNAIDNDSFIIKYAGENLKSDKDFLVTAIKKNSHTFNFICDDLKRDKRFISELIKENPEVFKFATDQIKRDKEFILELIKENPKTLNFMDNVDKEIKSEIVSYFMRTKLDLYLENSNTEQLKEIKELVNKIAELKADRENVNRDLYFADTYDKSSYYEEREKYERKIEELGKINPKALKIANEIIVFSSSPASDAREEIDLKIFNKTVDLKIKELNIIKNNDKGVNLYKPGKEEMEVMKKVANFSKEYLQDNTPLYDLGKYTNRFEDFDEINYENSTVKVVEIKIDTKMYAMKREGESLFFERTTVNYSDDAKNRESLKIFLNEIGNEDTKVFHYFQIKDENGNAIQEKLYKHDKENINISTFFNIIENHFDLSFSKELQEKIESKINNLENTKNKTKIHIPKKQKNKDNENER